jgi:hypothetical protein
MKKFNFRHFWHNGELSQDYLAKKIAEKEVIVTTANSGEIAIFSLCAYHFAEDMDFPAGCCFYHSLVLLHW